MKNNKLFLAIVVLVGIIAFIGLSMNQQAPTEKPAEVAVVRVSDEILIRPDSHIKGVATAPVTVVEFLDPECEACSAMHPIVKTILAEYGDKIRFVTRYMPFHGNSIQAAAALEEARELGKYDEALEQLFNRQPEWASHHAPRPDLIAVFLQGLVPAKRLTKDYLIGKHKAKIERDKEDGVKAGVRATPTFFVNGVMLNEIGYRPVKDAIDKAMTEKTVGSN